MRVLLVNPPLLSARTVQPPLSLCTIAAQLIISGNQVSLLDFDLELKESGHSSVAMRDRFASELRAFQPDAIGFTSMYNNSQAAQQLIAHAKRVAPEALTFAGGPHFGAQGAEALRHIAELDFVIEGEAEVASVALVDAMANGRPLKLIPSLVYRINGEVVRTTLAPLMNLADLSNTWEVVAPHVDLQRYVSTIPKNDNLRSVWIEAGRGCPHKCTFCAPAVFWRREYRTKTPKQIVDEMSFLFDHLGYNTFVLVHDLLTVSADFVSTFCEAFVDAKLPIRWMANARTDQPHLMSLLPKMAQSGCWKLFFGLESASDRIQQHIKKGLTTLQSRAVVERAEQLGIETTCSFVIGHPDETIDELSDTIAYAASLKLTGAETVQLHRLRLFPPAPITLDQKIRPTFDLDTLLAEYPFVEIAQAEIDAIQAAPDFFSGYFAPSSAAGSAAQLAQVELVMPQALAITPITVCAIARSSKRSIVELLYEAIKSEGHLNRMSLDPTAIDLPRNLQTIEPLLMAIMHRCEASGQEREINYAIYCYEKARLYAVYGDRSECAGLRFLHDHYAEFESLIQIDRVIDCLRRGLPFGDEIRRPCRIAFVRARDQASLRAIVL